MPVNDAQWEKKLGIRTTAADYEKDDSHHSRYEPTSYAALSRLAETGLIGSKDILVDYGCGKGRVGFYFNYVLNCTTVGIEYNEQLCRLANNNKTSFAGKNHAAVEFVNCTAENYIVENENSFYFFNPFSQTILRSVLNRIFDSYYANPRLIRLYFYYALDSYRELLMTDDRLCFECEIDCRDLFHNDDPKEKILVFSIG